jgi:hypothetical protein
VNRHPDSSSSPCPQERGQWAANAPRNPRAETCKALSPVVPAPANDDQGGDRRKAENLERDHWIRFLACQIALDILRTNAVKENESP